jgi:hypothetical protein
MRGGTIWAGKPESGPVSRKVRGENAVTEIAPMGPFFARNRQKGPVSWPKIGDFSGFLFTDKYTGAIGQAVYFVSLVLITAPQKAGF